MSRFNAQAARAKRPCPIWVDAFQRDTQHLEADEIGAYFLLLMAMWTRESCDFPDDDSRLARVCRVSTRLWKSRIGPVIRSFLTVKDGAVFSKRLREEAAYVERQVKQQSDRKSAEKSDKPLEDNDAPPSADISTDEPRNHPSQQPNNPTDIPIANAIGGDAPKPPPAADDLPEPDDDFAKQLFDRAVAFLGRHGTDDRQARSLVGKWRKNHGDAEIFEAFSACHKAGVVDPVPWLVARFKPKPEQGQPAINDNVIRMVNESLGIAEARRIS